MKSIQKKKTIIKLSKRKKKQKLINFVKLYSAIKIQRYFRKYQIKMRLSDIERRIINPNEKFINDSTFIGKTLYNLDKIYFYKHSGYFFDVRELKQHILNSNKHPYTNILFNKFSINQILRIDYNLLNNYNKYKYLDEEDLNILSNKHFLTGLKTDIFLKIDKNIGISNLNRFNNYNELDLLWYIENILKYSLINELINSESTLLRLDFLYSKFRYEEEYYKRIDTSYLDKFYKYRFKYHHYILNLLLKIVNHKDNSLVTRCHILNENICNLFESNDENIIDNFDLNENISDSELY